MQKAGLESQPKVKMAVTAATEVRMEEMVFQRMAKMVSRPMAGLVVTADLPMVGMGVQSADQDWVELASQGLEESVDLLTGEMGGHLLAGRG